MCSSMHCSTCMRLGLETQSKHLNLYCCYIHCQIVIMDLRLENPQSLIIHPSIFFGRTYHLHAVRRRCKPLHQRAINPSKIILLISRKQQILPPSIQLETVFNLFPHPDNCNNWNYAVIICKIPIDRISFILAASSAHLLRA